LDQSQLTPYFYKIVIGDVFVLYQKIYKMQEFFDNNWYRILEISNFWHSTRLKMMPAMPPVSKLRLPETFTLALHDG